MSDLTSPLAGLRVIDCATVIAAPAAAMILADFGADVIKIEEPEDGDMLRMLSDIPSTPDAGSDWFWQMDGRNKRGITLNLKEPDAIKVLHEAKPARVARLRGRADADREPELRAEEVTAPRRDRKWPTPGSRSRPARARPR